MDNTQFWIKVFASMNQETKWFIEAILVSALFFHIRFTPDNVAKAPSFLTTLGILGTFIGIAMGLLDFNANDIQKSVPTLIDGIKTAVWASACGIGCALTVKLRDILVGRRIGAKKSSGATINDLASSLKAIEGGMDELNRSLSASTELSLIGQMRLTRQDSNEKLSMLNHTLENFFDKVAEANSRALIKALQEVVHDFNNKISEQFGENFKHMNLALEKMLQWQQSYAQQITDLINQQGITARSMAVATEKYQVLVQNADVFNTVANSFTMLLAGLETQRTQLDGNMRSLAGLINTASTGLPEIERKIVEMTRQIGEGLKTGNDEFNLNVKTMIQNTKDQVLVLDNALSEELTKSLDSLGRQLAALSQKFVADYAPITEKLQSVLKLAG